MKYQTQPWAKSVQEKDIELYSSHPLDQVDSPILLIGGVHGDEPLGVELAHATLQWLDQNSHRVNEPWILIPCLNPDGLALKERVNGNGVDLNRNYPSKNWSPDFEKPRYFPGPSPGSEPEIQAVVKLIKDSNPKFIIHFHSWKPCVVCTGAPAMAAARHLSTSSGYPIVESIGYETPGSLSEYGWHDQQIPIICIEEDDDEKPGNTWNNFSRGLIGIFCQDLS